MVGQDLNRIHDAVDLLVRGGVGRASAAGARARRFALHRAAARAGADPVAPRWSEERRDGRRKSLGAFAETATIPVACLLEDAGEQQRLKALWSGAVEVFPEPFGYEHAAQVSALVEHLTLYPPPKPGSIDAVMEGVLRHSSRLRRSGVLELNPGFPFAGRATFAEGKLVSADFGPLSGMAALEEMLWTENGAWRFTPGVGTRAPEQVLRHRPPPSPYAPRVLLADDDPELREMLAAHLAVSGFEVRTAADGRSALETARAMVPDVAIADLDMPGLDGWGLLRALEGDHLTAEVMLAVLSAHDDWREALQGARAGPVEYLPKSWRLDEVVRRVRELTTPRERAFQLLRAGRPLPLQGGTVERTGRCARCRGCAAPGCSRSPTRGASTRSWCGTSAGAGAEHHAPAADDRRRRAGRPADLPSGDGRVPASEHR